MASKPLPTCLAGLDLALKWVGRGSDPEVARRTAAVAMECAQRSLCHDREECDQRLDAIATLLAPPSSIRT